MGPATHAGSVIWVLSLCMIVCTCVVNIQQVYASYMYRRDLAHAAQVSNALASARPMHSTPHEKQQQQQHIVDASFPKDVVVQTPDVRQAIAWEFALRALRDHEVVRSVLVVTKSVLHHTYATTHTQTHRATSLLQAHHGPEHHVRDVQIQLRVLHRRARLLYLPAYVLRYVFGVTLNAHGERRANEFLALVGGTRM